jgi:hypothetical protein
MRQMRPRAWNYHNADFDGRTIRLQATFSLSLAGISCATLHIQVNAHRQPQETGQESPRRTSFDSSKGMGTHHPCKTTWGIPNAAIDNRKSNHCLGFR